MRLLTRSTAVESLLALAALAVLRARARLTTTAAPAGCFRLLSLGLPQKRQDHQRNRTIRTGQNRKALPAEEQRARLHSKAHGQVDVGRRLPWDTLGELPLGLRAPMQFEKPIGLGALVWRALSASHRWHTHCCSPNPNPKRPKTTTAATAVVAAAAKTMVVATTN